MGLPTSRDETLTDASKVRSALLNKLQDCIISSRRAAWKRSVGTICTGGSGAVFTATSVTGWYANFAGTGVFHVPADVGDRIIGCELMVAGDGVHNVTYTLQVTGIVAGAIVSTPIGSVTEAPAATNNRKIAVGSVTPTILAADQWFQISAVVNGAGIILVDVIPQFDRL